MFLLKTQPEVEHAKSNLKISISQIWVIFHLLLFCQSRALQSDNFYDWFHGVNQSMKSNFEGDLILSLLNQFVASLWPFQCIGGGGGGGGEGESYSV